jgi:hypothetical protein
MRCLKGLSSIWKGLPDIAENAMPLLIHRRAGVTYIAAIKRSTNPRTNPVRSRPMYRSLAARPLESLDRQVNHANFSPAVSDRFSAEAKEV